MAPRLPDILAPLWERRYTGARRVDSRPVEALLADLLTTRGEVTGMSLARQVLDRYAKMDAGQRRAFFHHLAEAHDIDLAALRAATDAYAETRTGSAWRALAGAAEPPRQELARRLNQVPGATGRLVAMRADLLPLLPEEPDLARVDVDLRHLFASWFNRGFLVLQPITWDSPASILEKIIAYEAVHTIDSWEALRRRIEPPDRRCFAFFHPAMPGEPLIFVEVALTRGIPASIQDLLAEGRPALRADEADTAVFYSISNCQAGLAGISFGNSLIKQVVDDLSQSLRTLSTFVTLSPIPGLRGWLEEGGRVGAKGDALKALAARYLLTAKDRRGQPRDPVARFHLTNGALVHDIHPEGDTSPNGRAQSNGAMVNYLYDLRRIAENHEGFAGEGRIPASRAVRGLARAAETRSGEKD